MNFLTSIYREAAGGQLIFFWFTVLMSVIGAGYMVGVYNLRHSWGKLDWLRIALAVGILFNKDKDIKAALFNPHVLVFQTLMFAAWFLFCMWLHWHLLLVYTTIYMVAIVVFLVIGTRKYTKKELEDLVGYHPTDHDDDAACNAM